MAKPPVSKSTQFSSERQPEKNGRPKGSRSMSTILKELLEAKIETIDENGQKTKVEARELMMRKLIKFALDNNLKPEINLKAMAEIYDRQEGKAAQQINQTIEDKTIVVNHTNDHKGL